jgi:hypothetical protein
VVGDDLLFLGVFDASSSDPGHLHRVLPGDVPDTTDAREKAKPDLEALTALPPFESHPHGALLGLGSGSTPERDRASRGPSPRMARWRASRCNWTWRPSTRCCGSTCMP